MYIDGEFYCGLSQEIVIKYDLHQGDDITDEDLRHCLEQEELARVRDRAYRLLNYRCRSMRELRMRLLAIGYDQHLVDKVIEDFLADKTLDDEHFANVFTADHTQLKPRGNNYIERELTKKGVDREIIKQVVEQRREHPLILAFLKRRFPKLKRNDLKTLQKARRQLLYRGFTPSAVQDALNEYKGVDDGQ